MFHPKLVYKKGPEYYFLNLILEYIQDYSRIKFSKIWSWIQTKKSV